MSARVGTAPLGSSGKEKTMVRRDLLRRLEKVWASYRRELFWAIERVNRKLGDEAFSKEKRRLFSQAVKRGDYSSPLVQEWVGLAERHHPIKNWRRIFRLDATDEGGLALGGRFQGETWSIYREHREGS